jgi:hypothetical protein
MTYDNSASWTNTSVRPGRTTPNDQREEQAFTSPFLPPTNITSSSSNPFQDMNVSHIEAPLSVSNQRDPDINAEVQDYARELSVLLNRMPTDILTPLMAGLRVQPTSVPTHDLLGLSQETPRLSTVQSINPFDALTATPEEPEPYHPSQLYGVSQPPSLVSTDRSDDSFLTIPDSGRQIHITPTQSKDRYTFDPGLHTKQFPVKVYFLKRYVHHRSPGRNGNVFRWHLRIEEGFPRAFTQWQISIAHGEYIFEDFGNSFVILGQKVGSEPVLFTFPISLSDAWASQGIHNNGRQCPLQYSDVLRPCYLSCMVTRGPRVGGFLHPACYSVPGSHTSSDKKSHQNYYVPTAVFQDDGLIITQAYATAFFPGSHSQ